MARIARQHPGMICCGYFIMVSTPSTTLRASLLSQTIHKLPKSGKWQHSGRFDLSKTRRFPQEHGSNTEYVPRMVGGNGEVREAGIGPLSSLPCNHLSGVVGRWSVVDGEIINDQ